MNLVWAWMVMITKLPESFTAFQSLEDTRAEGGNKRHSLFDIVFIILCATVAGCETYTEVEQFADERSDWFGEFLKLENGIPSHDTIGRVLAALETCEVRGDESDEIITPIFLAGNKGYPRRLNG